MTKNTSLVTFFLLLFSCASQWERKDPLLLDGEEKEELLEEEFEGFSETVNFYESLHPQDRPYYHPYYNTGEFNWYYVR